MTQIKKVWGIFPYILKVDDSIAGQGEQKGFVVRVRDIDDYVTLEHEIVHVKQLYLELALIVALLVCSLVISPLFIALLAAGSYLGHSTYGELRRETAAYAVTARLWVRDFGWGEKEAIEHVSELYYNSDLYKGGHSLETVVKYVSRRYKDKRIF